MEEYQLEVAAKVSKLIYLCVHQTFSNLTRIVGLADRQIVSGCQCVGSGVESPF